MSADPGDAAARTSGAALAGGLGFCHPPLHGGSIVKGLYVAASWTAVTLALPARPAARRWRDRSSRVEQRQ